MSRRLAIAVATVIVLAAAQLVPVSRENPPVEQIVPAPAEVSRVLERSCYDCHSHETVWPWYAWVAPVSWLVAHDVNEGREHLNFSTWNRYDEEEQREKREEVWEEVEEGEMPMAIYLPLHREAELSDADRRLLEAWSGSGD